MTKIERMRAQPQVTKCHVKNLVYMVFVMKNNILKVYCKIV